MVLIPLRKYSPKLDMPYVTVTLIAINSAVYLYGLLFAGQQPLTLRYGFTSAHPTTLTWVTHLFIHGGVLHLVGNMFFLYHFGMVVEQAVGRVGFGLLYLLTGFCAAGIEGLVHWGSATPMIGASGAVSGVLGLYVALFPTAEASLKWILGTWYIGTWEIDSKGVGFVWLVYQLFLVSLVGTGLGEAGIAYFAHIGGLGAGFALGYGLQRLGVGAALERQMYGLAAKEEQGDPELWHSAAWLARGIGVTLLLLVLGAGYQDWQRHLAFAPATVGIAITQPTGTLLHAQQGAVRPLAVWSDLYSQEPPVEVPRPVREVLTLAFSADSAQVAIANDTNLVQIIPVRDDQPVRAVQMPIKQYTQRLESLRFSPDGGQLALLVRKWLASDSFLYLYQIADNALTVVTATDAVTIHALAYRDDGQLLVAVTTATGELAMHQVSDGQLVPAFALPAHTQFCGFSENGAWFILCYPSTIAYSDWIHAVELWDSAGHPHGRTPGLYGALQYSKVANDGARVILQIKGEAAQIWQVESEQPFVALPAIPASGKGIRFSGNLTLVLALATRGEVELFEANRGTLIDVLSLRSLLFGPRIMDARFSPDERFIVTRNTMERIHLWGVTPSSADQKLQ